MNSLYKIPDFVDKQQEKAFWTNFREEDYCQFSEKTGHFVSTAIEYKGELVLILPKQICKNLNIKAGDVVDANFQKGSESVLIKTYPRKT